MSGDAGDEEEAIEAGVTAASEEIISAARTTDLFRVKLAPVGPANSILETVVRYGRWYQIPGARSDAGLP
jgi:hypothetical protein